MTYVVGKGLALAPIKSLVLSEWPQSDWQRNSYRHGVCYLVYC